MKYDITYDSTDTITKIHAVVWQPETEVKAVVQVAHGMIEHINRYDKFARYLNKFGILVCGEDHLGHGLSVIDDEHRGYFAQKKGYKVVIEDVHNLTLQMKEKYKNVPYILLGHSMGSFIARTYVETYSQDIDALIVTGSGYKSKLLMKFAKFVCSLTALYHHGWLYRSPFLYKMTNGGYAKYFEEGASDSNCWLTNDKTVLEEYKNDPLVHFKFTCNAYLGLFNFIEKACSKSKCKKIRKDLPILMLTGKDDPVGKFGNDIYTLEKLYKKSGIKNVKIKIYNGMRHELLNETNKVIVLNDIKDYIEKLEK